MMGKIFCFIGKSSSGKDTIYNIILNDLKEMKTITPYTTRPIRDGETNGVEYYFVSNEEFERMKQNNLVAEARSYNTVYGIWTYFTSAEEIDLENNNYMVINTLEGFDSLKEYFGEDKVIPIYIYVDDITRLERALEREKKQQQPKLEEMCRRFLADQEDFSEEKLKASNINKRYRNWDLSKCTFDIENDINEYLEKEKQLRK